MRLLVAVGLIVCAIALQKNDPNSVAGWVFFCLGVGWVLREVWKTIKNRKRGEK